MVGVAEVEGTDARDVGRDSDLIVGDAHGSPDAAHTLGTLAKDFEDPGLVLVGNGEALAAVAIAIFLDQLTHEAYRFASRGATLECDACQLFDHEHASLVLQGIASRNGGLAHGQLLLVKAGIGGVEEAVGVAHLGYGVGIDHAVEILG